MLLQSVDERIAIGDMYQFCKAVPKSISVLDIHGEDDKVSSHFACGQNSIPEWASFKRQYIMQHAFGCFNGIANSNRLTR